MLREQTQLRVVDVAGSLNVKRVLLRDLGISDDDDDDGESWLVVLIMLTVMITERKGK